MKFSNLLIPAALLAFCPAFADAAGARNRGVIDHKKTLAEAGLEYKGKRIFIAEKNNRRGDWKGKRPAFWTLAASDGGVKLRLELTKNVTRAQAEKTMDERFQRIDALYSGGAAYPGTVTTEFEVPQSLRPQDIKAGPAGNRAKALAATQNMTYGAGAEDLVSHRGLLGYLYCEKTALLAQIELLFPKAEFKLENAKEEFGRFVCAGSPPAPAKAQKSEKSEKPATSGTR